MCLALHSNHLSCSKRLNLHIENGMWCLCYWEESCWKNISGGQPEQRWHAFLQKTSGTWGIHEFKYTPLTKSKAPLRPKNGRDSMQCVQVIGHKGSYNEEASFHRFHKDLSCQESGLKTCQRQDHVHLSSSSIRSKHYGPECFSPDLREEPTMVGPKEGLKCKAVSPMTGFSNDLVKDNFTLLPTLYLPTKKNLKKLKQVLLQLYGTCIRTMSLPAKKISTPHMVNRPTSFCYVAMIRCSCSERLIYKSYLSRWFVCPVMCDNTAWLTSHLKSSQDYLSALPASSINLIEKVKILRNCRICMTLLADSRRRSQGPLPDLMQSSIHRYWWNRFLLVGFFLILCIYSSLDCLSWHKNTYFHRTQHELKHERR